MDATLQPAGSSSSSSATPPIMGSARRWARRLERWCCTCAKYFPLAFVYGLTTWAAFVLVSLCSSPSKVSWLGMFWGYDIFLDN
jgi:palmitoyltransferase